MTAERGKERGEREGEEVISIKTNKLIPDLQTIVKIFQTILKIGDVNQKPPKIHFHLKGGI